MRGHDSRRVDQISKIQVSDVSPMSRHNEPAYTVINQLNSLFPSNIYQIRHYSPIYVSKVTESIGNSDAKFGILAKYIGVFGNPQNLRNEKIAMTSPGYSAN